MLYQLFPPDKADRKKIKSLQFALLDTFNFKNTLLYF